MMDVPDKFLNRRLFSGDKEQLCRTMRFLDSQGRLYKLPTVKKKLKQYGYNIKEGRQNNKRYIIVTPRPANF